jgi:hypothetical protein
MPHRLRSALPLFSLNAALIGGLWLTARETDAIAAPSKREQQRNYENHVSGVSCVFHTSPHCLGGNAIIYNLNCIPKQISY